MRLVVLATGAVAVALFVVHSLAEAADEAWRTTIAAAAPAPRPLLLPFGISQVKVFNESDMRMGTAVLMLAEEDEGGRVLRIVPFLDKDGGRLDYMRNDFLYFAWSLRWQRLPREEQMTSAAPPAPTERTRTLAQQVARLDACLEGGGARPRRYRAWLLLRDIERRGRIPVWTDATPVLSWDVETTSDSKKGLTGTASLLGCYDLPPGHARSGVRTRETLHWARNARRELVSH